MKARHLRHSLEARVPSFNLWLFYSFDSAEVRVLMIAL
jgi:hypothetical protein